MSEISVGALWNACATVLAEENKPLDLSRVAQVAKMSEDGPKMSEEEDKK